MLDKYYIIDYTLKELNDNFKMTSLQKSDLLLILNNFGIEYICISSDDLETISKIKNDLCLSTKIIVNVSNFEKYLVQDILKNKYISGLNFTINIDSFLIKTFHEKTISNLLYTLKFVRDMRSDIMISISIENCFEKSIDTLSKLVFTIEDYIDLISVIDTKGSSTHYNVENIICLLKNITTSSLSIGCHFYNDSSSAVYNTFIALSNGCSFINTSILGLGKRNGITDLSGIIARLYSVYPESVKKYNLFMLKQLNKFVSSILNIPIPRNNPIINDILFFNLHNSIDDKHKIYTDLDTFLKHHMSNVYINLKEEYIKTLQDKLKQDALNNHILAELFNDDLEFTKKYILRYIN